MFVVAVVPERFLSCLSEKHDKHPVSTDDGDTWYPHEACRFLKLKHHLYPLMRKA